MSSRWTVEHYEATAQRVHALGVPDVVTRTVRVFTPSKSAIVLGSTQPETDVDARVAQELDIDIVKRRSGGGAVLVERDDIIWLDVLIPSDDVLWTDDVGRAFHWLGNALAQTLSSVGVDGVEIYEGALKTTEWSKKICFAGLGPGECTLDSKKILGISQRRTRQGSLFQASINKRFDGLKIARLLSVPPEVMVEGIAPAIGELPQLNEETFVAALLQRLDLV